MSSDSSKVLGEQPEKPENTGRLVRRCRYRGRRQNFLALLVIAMLALIGSACSVDSESEESGGSESAQVDFATEDSGDAFEEMEEAEAAAEEGAMAADEDSGDGELAGSPSSADDGSGGNSDADSPLGAGGVSVTPTAADLGRKLIFTALVEVGVDDVAAASAEATSIVESMGGFLFGQNTIGGSQARSELTFKILPADFNRALEQLGSVGELRNQSVTTDDVTERIVDLESRIEVADLGVARLRSALEGAATLEDYAEIERLLLDRESDLEVMRGQLRTLQDRVDLSTITLVLTQDRVENGIDLRISTYEGFDSGESCPGQQQNSVAADSDVTVCFELTNVGDQTLTDIAVTDTVLEIDGETQLIEVFGTFDELAPGQSALAAYEIKPERSLRLRTRVVAIPTDGVSSAQAGPSVSTRLDYDLRTFEPETDPGFGDGFSAAVDILKGLWVALTVLVGFLILPLLILVPLVWLTVRGWREYRRRRPAKVNPPPPSAPWAQSPPPPQAAPATAAATTATPEGQPPAEGGEA